MKRWLWFSICALLGGLLLLCGWLVPVHLRAVDEGIIERAGRGTPDFVGRGMELVGQDNLGAAQMVLAAAQAQGVTGWVTLNLAISALAQQHPAWLIWGGGEPGLGPLFAADSHPPKSGPEPFTEFIIRLENRQRALDMLKASGRPGAMELLKFRKQTNTMLFPPSASASGQALDAAIAICGLLMEQGRLNAGFSDSVTGLAAQANRGLNSQPFEQVLMDLMTLGQQFNWNQLAVFVSKIPDAETLRHLTAQVHDAGAQLPILFSAVEISGKPKMVARHLLDFSETGLKDLGSTLQYGQGGLNELLRLNQRLYVSEARERAAGIFPLGLIYRLALDYCWRVPGFALTVKWLLYLAAGFTLAMAAHFARPAVADLERPLQVRGFHLYREFLFALGFLLVVLLLSEPFLAQESQKVEFHFQLRLPTVGGAFAAGTGASTKSSLMDKKVLLTMLVFFVLQGLLYVASLVKLAEIRRQRVPSRIKLKLLENEDHLFDAGLYLGLLGTIVSFVLVSMKLYEHPSLMAAYSSTSFGILFVIAFKVLNLRPARRHLLLEAEADTMEEPAGHATAAPIYASQP
jgi:hypothetical protein